MVLEKQESQTFAKNKTESAGKSSSGVLQATTNSMVVLTAACYFPAPIPDVIVRSTGRREWHPL